MKIREASALWAILITGHLLLVAPTHATPEGDNNDRFSCTYLIGGLVISGIIFFNWAVNQREAELTEYQGQQETRELTHQSGHSQRNPILMPYYVGSNPEDETNSSSEFEPVVPPN